MFALPSSGGNETRAFRCFLPALSCAQPSIASRPPRGVSLAVALCGLKLDTCIGLAAGFDKDAEVPDPMLRAGFGFVECGTVTPKPQAGNPRPRLFRLTEDRAVINRMGFNNRGMAAAAVHLQARRKNGIVGINIGANKDSADRIADYAQSFARLAPLADYVTVNVSSPNTPGLRGLQNKDELTRLLSTMIEARARLPFAQSAGGVLERLREKDGGGVPILLKIAPDLDGQGLDDIAESVIASGIEGVIVSNTTVARPPLKNANAREAGGLSGRPLFAPSTEILRQMRTRLPPGIVLIGVGGISSGADAYEKIRAGASLVQLYTGLVYEGPGLVMRIKRELLALLTRDGFATIADAVGTGL